MMDLQMLFDFDEWANKRVYSELQKLPDGEHSAEIRKLFSHILAAQNVWIARINPKEHDIPQTAWPLYSDEEMNLYLLQNPKTLKSLTSRASEVIRYANFRGDEFENVVEDLLLHLVIHGQHHRAQINTLLRKAGNVPPGIDYIFFRRALNN